VRIPRFIDSHTEGEPTRALVAADGGPLDATLPEVLAAWTTDGVQHFCSRVDLGPVGVHVLLLVQHAL